MQHYTQYTLHKVLGHSYLLNVNKIGGGGGLFDFFLYFTMVTQDY